MSMKIESGFKIFAQTVKQGPATIIEPCFTLQAGLDYEGEKQGP